MGQGPQKGMALRCSKNRGVGSGPTHNERAKEKSNPMFKLCSEIGQMIDLERVMEERILNSRLEFALKEILEITKKEFHDVKTY